MRIGIDVDDVLNNLVDKWVEKYNLLYRGNLQVEDITSWDICQFSSIGADFYRLLDAELWSSLRPLEGSVEITKKLQDAGHELILVTATHKKDVECKVNWLEEHFPHLDLNNLIITRRKDLVDVDVLVDDGGHNIEAFPGDVLVMDRPWNRYLGEEYARVYSWEEIGKRFGV